MMPLEDDVPSSTTPVVTVLIVIANVQVMLAELCALVGGHIQEIVYRFGVVPYRFVHHFDIDQIITSFTSMFMHGGLLHLVGNMWFLLIFGDNVEDRLGHFRYLMFYLLCGLIAGVAQVIPNAESSLPSIGASGAIAGVLGAYFVLYPNARVKTVIFSLFSDFFGPRKIVWVPAYAYIGFWFLLQCLLNLITAEATNRSGGVAWWAHIGGFAAGALLVKVFMLGRPQPVETPSADFESAQAAAEASGQTDDAENRSWTAWTFVFVSMLVITVAGFCSYEAIGSLDISAYIEYLQGESSLNDRHYKEAIAHFDKTIERAPKCWNAYWQQGLAYEYSGQSTQSIGDFQQVIELNPKLSGARGHIAYNYFLLTDYTNAVHYCDEELKLQPNDENVTKLRATCLDDLAKSNPKALTVHGGTANHRARKEKRKRGI